MLDVIFNKKETVTVNLIDSKGKVSKLMLTEESQNSGYFKGLLKTPDEQMTVSYGLGYFEKSALIGKNK